MISEFSFVETILIYLVMIGIVCYFGWLGYKVSKIAEKVENRKEKKE